MAGKRENMNAKLTKSDLRGMEWVSQSVSRDDIPEKKGTHGLCELDREPVGR